MIVLKIKNLKKSFGGHQVIDGLDVTVPEGSIFGFIGPNGSGKTTTMKMVLGLLKADAGEIIVCGESVSYGETKTNRHIGYLPDVPEFYGYMKPKEYLRLCGTITGMSKEAIRKRSAELLGLVGLSDVNRKIAGFSRGMKQRLGIAQALLNEPALLICDEPTSALDPVGRKEILDILASVRGKTTVVFSTHILSDVERICDRIAVLHNGTIDLSGSLADIKAHHAHHGYLIEFAHEADLTRFESALSLSRKGVQLTRSGLELEIFMRNIDQHSPSIKEQSISATDGISAADDIFSSDDISATDGISSTDGVSAADSISSSDNISVADSISVAQHISDGASEGDLSAQGHTLIQLLADSHITPLRFELLEPTLENLFMEVVA